MADTQQGNEGDSDLSLDLSCSSSLFDDHECIDSQPLDERKDIAPYQFEPVDEDNEEGSGIDHSPDSDIVRLGNTDWCTCGNCIQMETHTESVCCAEIQQMGELINLLDTQVECVLQHPGFEPVVLNLYVLQTAYLQYKQQYGEEVPESNEKYRYTAYRQLARWAWGYLGKKVRVVLPSCAVNTIRNTFPAVDHTYKGFNPP